MITLRYINIKKVKDTYTSKMKGKIDHITVELSFFCPIISSTSIFAFNTKKKNMLTASKELAI